MIWPDTVSVTASTRRDSELIPVSATGMPERPRSSLISSPVAPPASPATTTSWPNRYSTRAAATPLPPARCRTREMSRVWRQAGASAS